MEEQNKIQLNKNVNLDIIKKELSNKDNTSTNNEMHCKYKHMINLIEESKALTKEIYKDVKYVNNPEDQIKFNLKVERVIKLLQKINYDSNIFKDVFVSKDYLSKLDNQNNSELDQLTSTQFLYGCQMLRGKLNNLTAFSKNLKNTLLN
jgi:hypothetical protein